jgi:hypothetical protein
VERKYVQTYKTETGRTERQSLCPAGGAKEGIIDFGNEEASTLRCSSGKEKYL